MLQRKGRVRGRRVQIQGLNKLVGNCPLGNLAVAYSANDRVGFTDPVYTLSCTMRLCRYSTYSSDRISMKRSEKSPSLTSSVGYEWLQLGRHLTAIQKSRHVACSLRLPASPGRLMRHGPGPLLSAATFRRMTCQRQKIQWLFTGPCC
jgi:hypothetical protein